jgi:hypothetical protein
MQMERPRLAQLGTAAALVLGMATGGASVAAQEATPVGTPAPPPGCTVIASGLMNPRQIDVAADGTIYVTEAGIGGDEELQLPSGGPGEQATPVTETGGTPVPAAPGPTRGTTGQVTAIAPDGTQSVVASGLPSYSLGNGEAVGPTGIVAGDDQLWVAIGGSYGLLGIDPLPNENSVVSIDLATGAVTQVADLGAFEVANNPDGTDVNPNLYGMDLGTDGQLYVADAGGNTVYKVDPSTGQFSLLGVVPQRPLPPGAAAPAPEASPAPGATPVANPLQAVPTALSIGSDGNVYVGLLGALVPGAGGIAIAQADGTFPDAITSRTAVVGVAQGPDGLLYASEISLNISNEPPTPGDVVRFETDGTVTPVLGGLNFPNGITFGHAGNLLVIVNSVSGTEPNGQVLRCTPTVSTNSSASVSSGLLADNVAALFGDS